MATTRKNNKNTFCKQLKVLKPTAKEIIQAEPYNLISNPRKHLQPQKEYDGI